MLPICHSAKLLHLDSYHVCFRFKSDIISENVLQNSKTQLPYTLKQKIQRASSRLYYTPNHSLIKNQINHPQIHQIMFQNSLKIRSKFLFS